MVDHPRSTAVDGLNRGFPVSLLREAISLARSWRARDQSVNQPKQHQARRGATGIGDEIGHRLRQTLLDVSMAKDIGGVFREFPEDTDCTGEREGEEMAGCFRGASQEDRKGIQSVKEHVSHGGAAEEMHREIERHAVPRLRHDGVENQHRDRRPGNAQKEFVESREWGAQGSEC